MNEHPKVRAEQHLIIVCLRLHQRTYISKAPIYDNAIVEETENLKCPQCGAMPMYCTDGLNMLGYNRVPQERPLNPEDY
jgi:hypothetical protein